VYSYRIPLEYLNYFCKYSTVRTVLRTPVYVLLQYEQYNSTSNATQEAQNENQMPEFEEKCACFSKESLVLYCSCIVVELLVATTCTTTVVVLLTCTTTVVALEARFLVSSWSAGLRCSRSLSSRMGLLEVLTSPHLFQITSVHGLGPQSIKASSCEAADLWRPITLNNITRAGGW
jgi:hypothetical protein